MLKNVILTLILLMLFACDNTSDEEILSGELTIGQKEDLQYLKEEEKLARDVYLYAFDKYAYRVFDNISKSEQTHMNRVTDILTAYQIEDLSLPERGKFTNPDLQKLYDDLTQLCDRSLEDALTAGATIEDLDINDIRDFAEKTEFEDVKNMYLSLECGSRNHMRAFSNNLSNLGIVYNPQFISEDEYNEIIDNVNEKCNF